jgi:hypothetical protein
MDTRCPPNTPGNFSNCVMLSTAIYYHYKWLDMGVMLAYRDCVVVKV